VQKLYTVDDSLKRLKLSSTQVALFVWLISHQPAVLSSQNKPATNNQPAVLFSQNKSAPATSQTNRLFTIESLQERVCTKLLESLNQCDHLKRFSAPQVINAYGSDVPFKLAAIKFFAANNSS
jgi:hypothetical protein